MDFTNFFVTEKDNGNPNLISLQNINESTYLIFPKVFHQKTKKIIIMEKLLM
jgi:hypothetical protein